VHAKRFYRQLTLDGDLTVRIRLSVTDQRRGVPFGRGGIRSWNRYERKYQQMRHKPRNIALLSMLTMLVIGVTASAASAAFEPTKFEWKVAGSSLASGSSRAFTAKDKSPGIFHLKWSIAGAGVELTSSKLKFNEAKILGGKPGTGEEHLVLEGVQVAQPKGCKVKEEKITTQKLKTEIVEAASGGVGIGKTELLLAPKSTTNWTELELEKSGSTECALENKNIPITGNLLTSVSPAKAEATVEQLTFEPSSKEYIVSGVKGAKSAELLMASNAAHLTGEAETELVSKEIFGAF
jgi:hypothetical protein